MLLNLEDKLVGFKIPPLIAINAEELRRTSPVDLASLVSANFGVQPLIVRSSAFGEDSAESSNAGAYESIMRVSSKNPEELFDAAHKVLSSYSIKENNSEQNEVIFQLMIEDSTMSGVIFTHELSSGAPYYVINYDDISGLTNSVTAGVGENANRTLYIYRGTTEKLRSSRFVKLMAAVNELEQVLNSQFLDIEFAIDADLQPWLFQVRPITTKSNWDRALSKRIDAELLGIQAFVCRRFQQAHGIYGKTTVLGQMPDWNPAEIIGRAPRALARSLYQKLLTDNAWRIARKSMGYSVPSGQPLMVSLAGQPFIDTRLSFHSYLPALLPSSVAEKLVDAWVGELRQHPELHDKIEFEVAITTFSFDIDTKLDRLSAVLTAEERTLFRELLRKLTVPLLEGIGKGSIARALAKVEKLVEQPIQSVDSGLAGLYRLIEDCISLGTVPFSVLARHGFIAHTLLRSLVVRGVFSDDDIALMLRGVRTIAGDLREDMHSLQDGSISSESFMSRYGHLRPGTYDILSPRYDQIEVFGSLEMDHTEEMEQIEAFSINPRQREALDVLLQNENFAGIDAEGLVNYCSAAIAGREYGKFVFTRSISAILESIAHLGEQYGLSREEMSHVPIDDLLDVASSSTGKPIEEHLREISEYHAGRNVLTSAIRLPQILFDEAGVYVVPFQMSQPNFVTSSKASAEIVKLDSRQSAPDLKGKIVLIENADPGYDWIFAQPIAGLITKFGGANSHMAIRCAEFGIPAAIGCGEQRFESCLKANHIILNCSVGQITILN